MPPTQPALFFNLCMISSFNFLSLQISSYIYLHEAWNCMIYSHVLHVKWMLMHFCSICKKVHPMSTTKLHEHDCFIVHEINYLWTAWSSRAWTLYSAARCMICSKINFWLDIFPFACAWFPLFAWNFASYACCMKNAEFNSAHICTFLTLVTIISCWAAAMLKKQRRPSLHFSACAGIFAWNFHLYISLYLHDLYARMARMRHVVHFSIPSSFPFYDLSISTVLLSCMLWCMQNNILHAHTPHFLALRGGFCKKLCLSSFHSFYWIAHYCMMHARLLD